MPRAKNTAKRLDPAPRPIDGALPYFNVLNKDPSREYVWVYKAATDYGPEHYSYLGYQLERYTDTGPRPAMAAVDMETGLTSKPSGTVIESRGNVLMSVSKERFKEIVQFGSDGVSGQEAANRQEKAMLNHTKHVKDSMRGINPRLMNGVSVESDKGSFAAVPAGEED
jgi:hypothetical protein